MTDPRRLSASVRTAFAALALLLFLSPVAQAAVKIQEVVSSSGVKAWLVEEYSVPVISIRFAFEGGETQDPGGQEGLINLMTTMFDEGAGDVKSEDFQIRMDDAGAEMRFSATRDNFYGSMRMLAEKKDEALELLRLAVTEPRFDEDPIARMKSQIVAGLRASARDPSRAAQQRWLEALYPGHPYSRMDEGTEESIARIRAEDLRRMHKAIFARDGLHVAVVGAIDAETLKRDLDRIFGALPTNQGLWPLVDQNPKLGQRVDYDYPLPQVSLQLVYPGLKRDDPGFFPAVLMNHVLGGGSFTSRLFKEVREQRGLTYGIDSSIVNYKHASALAIVTSTRADKGEETLAVIRDVVKRMADEGPTGAELEDAKRYLIGSYAINNLDSSSSIAATLLELQLSDLGIDYMDRRAGYINSVTVEQAREAARRLLLADPAVMWLGPSAKGGG